jgi:prenyltransferase beta subunit
MTIRTDMLRTVGKAKELLDDSAGAVLKFALGRLNPDGGFKGRSEQSDLYYTVFGLELLTALQADIPYERILDYLRRFDADRLDLVHLASLVRCYSDIEDCTGSRILDNVTDEVVRCLDIYRSEDGGFGTTAGTKFGNVYGCFLSLGIYQDIKVTLTGKDDVVSCILSSKKDDGGYANEQILTAGTTPATAAAVVSLHYLEGETNESSLDWILSRAHPDGGFVAIPNDASAAIPDLLSTATALHALSLGGISIENIKEKCLDYLDGLWSTDGGFAGNWFDTVLDCEYTYYGLLSLGHLST